MSLGLVLGLAIWWLALSLTALGTWIALKHLGSPPPHLDAPFGLFPVTVLKPLKGADDGLRENLRSFFRLDYPGFEILFSVADERDPAHAIVAELIHEHPGVSARLLVGGADVGPNPKVNNMLKAYEQARHDWLLVSDSNVRVEPDYLKRLVAHLEPGVGILTSAVAGFDAQGLGGHLEATYLNTFYARGMALAFAFGQPCVIGKSMLFRKSVAARFGGIQVLSRYLAEDYVAGEAMRHLGMKVVLARDPVRQFIGEHSFAGFWSRHIRWGRIRKSQSPVVFLLEALLSSVGSGLMGAAAFSAWFAFPPLLFLVLHLSAWGFCDMLLMRRMGQAIGLRSPAYWLLREALWLPLWAHTMSGNSVIWRGQRLRLQPGGVLEAK